MSVQPDDPTRSADRAASISRGENTSRLDSPQATTPTHTLPEILSPIDSLPPHASVITVPGYEVHGELKRGGMGVVYTARQTALDREVAIKTLRPDRVGDARMCQRFVTEAHVTAKLQHPAVPPVFEVGRLADDRPYLVMKLIRGRDLEELLDQRSSPAADLPRFLAVFEQVCQAVGYAHSRHIIHRDLKPANVMVGEFGEVQVMDWGIARVLAGGPTEEPDAGRPPGSVSSTAPSSSGSADTGLTQTGTAMGTPAYMAPEQARGEWDKVDARADVFALGGILCDILTGQPPFVAKTGQLTAIIAASGDVTDAFNRLDACGADVELIALAKHCLQPNSGDRPADGKAVADTVAAYRASVETRLWKAEAERAAAAVREEEARLRATAEVEAKQAAEARALAEAKAKQAAEERASEATHRARAEEAKVAEQRRRRRTEQWLAAAIGLLLAGGGAVAWWQDSQAMRRAAEQKEAEANAQAEEARRQKADAEQKAAFAKAEAEQALALQKAQNERNAAIARTRAGINSALKLATELRAEHKYREASEALDQAELLAMAGGADDLTPAIARERDDLRFARELDRIRARKWSWVSNPDGTGGHFDTSSAPAAYATAFAAHGLDIAAGDPATTARKIAHSPLKVDLLRALDDWSVDEPDAALGEKLLKVARLAAPAEKLANMFRNPAVRGDQGRLLELTTQSDDITLSVPATLVAANLLERHKADPSRLLAVAQARHPDDFDLTFALALWYHTRRPEQAIGHYRAARAIRPEDHAVLTNLGLLLTKTGELPAAAAVLREAVRLHPNDPIAHFNLGGVLVLQNKLPAAEAEYRKTIQLNPKYAAAYCKLGTVLSSLKQYGRATEELSKAVDVVPNDAVMRIHYGEALRHAGKLDAGIDQLRKATDLAPQSAAAHYSLGAALEEKKDLPSAYKEYREAARLDPKQYGDLLKKLPLEK